MMRATRRMRGFEWGIVLCFVLLLAACDPEDCEECLGTGTCTNHDDCGADAFCAKALGQCDEAAEGVCESLPEACPELWSPVCGCDGETYSNSCFAQAARITLDYVGDCRSTESCDTNDDCASDEYCARPSGSCGGEGTCQERPDICLDFYDPVCGCDFRTYDSSCQAMREGQSIFSEGVCEIESDCTDNDDCAAVQFCVKMPGQCEITGICVERPEACPDIYYPVCGCDGVSYANQCVAAGNGASLQSMGTCDHAADCTDNDDCEESRYCLKMPGECSEMGLCVDRPVRCPAVWAPVCGCDGETYDSECVAAREGVAVDYAYACEPDYDCMDDSDCTDARYCMKGPGDCDGEGICTNRPDACPDVWSPVCGCDGITYANDCDASANGVNVAGEGACEPVSDCSDDGDCAGSSYCLKEPGDCDGDGMCEEPPLLCRSVYDPVCGCDGITYDNACLAARARINVASEGVCVPESDCSENDDCSGGRFCAKAPGDCAADGLCTSIPEDCPLIYLPVCGCDGETYVNDCVAASYSTSVAALGACPVTSDCSDNGDCDTDYFCLKSPGDCDGDGVCYPEPSDCPAIYMPVCGCDGVTYPNECVAQAAGTNVDSDGACLIDGDAEGETDGDLDEADPGDPPYYDGSAAFGGSSSNQFARDVAVDASGNSYLIGDFYGSLSIGGSTYTSQGLGDIILIKVLQNGTVDWAKRFGDGSRQDGLAVAVDENGGVLIGGVFAGSVNFGGDPGDALTASGGTDIYVAKFTAAGVHVWSDRFGDSDWQYLNDLACDSSDSVYITGDFKGNVDFGGDTLTSSGGSDIYVAKFNNNGVHQWSKRYGDSAVYQAGTALSTVTNMYVYVGGYFSGTIDFGAEPLTSAGYYDAFVAKLNANNGAKIWSKRYGDEQDQELSALVADPQGKLWMTGSFESDLQLDATHTLTSGGGYDIYLVKLDFDGSYLWSERFGGSGNDFGRALACDTLGYPIAAGTFQGNDVSFGGEAFSSAGAQDVYVMRYTGSGSHVWSIAYGSTGDQVASGLAADGSTAVWVGGFFNGQIDFDPDGPAHYSQGDPDLFLLRLTHAP